MANSTLISLGAIMFILGICSLGVAAYQMSFEFNQVSQGPNTPSNSQIQSAVSSAQTQIRQTFVPMILNGLGVSAGGIGLIIAGTSTSMIGGRR